MTIYATFGDVCAFSSKSGQAFRQTPNFFQQKSLIDVKQGNVTE